MCWYACTHSMTECNYDCMLSMKLHKGSYHDWLTHSFLHGIMTWVEVHMLIYMSHNVVTDKYTFLIWHVISALEPQVAEWACSWKLSQAQVNESVLWMALPAWQRSSTFLSFTRFQTHDKLFSLAAAAAENYRYSHMFVHKCDCILNNLFIHTHTHRHMHS